jgi:hypothetical protein
MLEPELRLCNPLLHRLIHQSTMSTSTLPRHPLINLHHQSLHPWILNRPYPTSAHQGPQLRTRRRIVMQRSDTTPAKSKKKKTEACSQRSRCVFLIYFEFFTVLHIFLPESAGIRSIPGIPRNRILAVVPAKIVISVPRNSGGFRNGPGITRTESTGTESAEFVF